MAWIPPVKTTYKGMEFRSKLEAKYARCFDKLGIKWVYEERNYMFDDGTCYAPDFYFPELDMFFEVKGIMDDKSKHKIICLRNEGECVIVGGPDGHMTLYDGKQRDLLLHEPDFEDDDDWDICWNGYCINCHRHIFVNAWGSYACPACGFYKGNGNELPDTDNLFEFVGW